MVLLAHWVGYCIHRCCIMYRPDFGQSLNVGMASYPVLDHTWYTKRVEPFMDGATSALMLCWPLPPYSSGAGSPASNRTLHSRAPESSPTTPT